LKKDELLLTGVVFALKLKLPDQVVPAKKQVNPLWIMCSLHYRFKQHERWYFEFEFWY